MHRRSSLSSTVVAAVGALALLAAGATPALAAAAPEVQVSSQERSFSPDGDGFEDAFTASYTLTSAANVTTSVVDAGGTVVRTLTRGESQPVGYRAVTWDGVDGAGRPAAAGAYVLRLTAENTAGSSTTTTSTAVDLRQAARVVAPVVGATLSGEVDVDVVQAGDLVLDTASASASGCSTPTAAPGEDGHVRLRLDTSRCAGGERDLSVQVTWRDAFGAEHRRSLLVPVRVVDQQAPSVYLSETSDAVVLTAPDRQSEVSGRAYCNDDTGSTVSVVVRSASATPVATLLEPGTPCDAYHGVGYRWDGRDDAGRVVPDPAQLTLRAVARDADGNTTATSAPAYLDRRVPGVLVSPSGPATDPVVVSGTTRLAVSAPSGVEATGVDFVLGRCRWSGTVEGPGPTPSAQASASSPPSSQSPQPSASAASPTPSTVPPAAGAPGTTFSVQSEVDGCAVGDATLSVTVSWTDVFGRPRTYGDTRAVRLADTTPPTVSIATYGAVSRTSPDQDAAVQLNGQCDDDADGATLVVQVLADTATVVRTLDARCNNSPYGWGSSWDGRDADGRVQPDGDYRVVATATDASGLTSRAEASAHVDRRVPSALVSPSAGQVIAATATVRVVPTAGTSVEAVSASVPGCPSLRFDAPGDDGALSAVLDGARCSSTGEQTLTATTYWQDAARRSYTWTDSRAVVLAAEDTTPPTVTPSRPQVLLALDSPQHAESVSQYLDCRDDRAVTGLRAEVRDARDELVATLAPLDVSGCNSYGYGYLSWDGRDSAGDLVPDGDYQVRLTATDAAGNAGTASVEVAVARRAPGVLAEPRPDAVLAGAAPLVFVPDTATATTTEQVDLRVAGRSLSVYNASADGLWRTTVAAGDLPSGPAVVDWTVRWSDSFGATHYFYGDSRPVTVDPDAVPLAASLDTSRGRSPLAVALTLDTSDGRGGPVQVDVDWGDGSAAETLSVASPYARVVLRHTYVSPGTPTVVVRARNAAGGSAQASLPVVAEAAPNQPPALEATVTPTRGVAPHDVTAALAATDPDSSTLRYKVDFGDGTAPSTGTLPAEAVPHRYLRPGTYLVRSSVSDGALTAARSSSVTVVLPEPVSASAGDDQQVVVGTEAVFDGGASRPAALLDSYRWTFGDGGSAEGSRTAHAYAAPGTYVATLVVGSDAERDSATSTVTVVPVPRTPGLTVRVRTGGGGLAGAQVVVLRPDGTRVTGTSDGSGVALLQGLPDGDTTVYAVAPGYKPKAVPAALTDGVGEVTVDLETGAVGAATVSADRLSVEEAVARGLDVSDESNYHVYEAQIHLFFGEPGGQPDPVVYVTRDGVACARNCDTYPDSIPPSGGTGPVEPCGCFSVGGAQFVPTGTYVHGEPVINWLVIPIRARFLKEFFDVKMIVQNLTEDFTFSPGTATLDLPAGLSLAPLSAPQSLHVDLDEVPGGQSRTASWVVRGDVEGLYSPSTSYSALLQPFDEPVELRAQVAQPLKVWGGSALKVLVDAEDQVLAGYPYTVRVGLQNVADVPVYNASVEYLLKDKVNYIYQPRESLLEETAQLDPGEVFWNDALLVPTISGSLFLDRSYVARTGGTVDLATEIRSVPRARPYAEVPQLRTVPLKDRVGLVWDPVPGAVGYEVFSTPDPLTDFGPEPALSVPASTTRAAAPLPGGTDAWFAVRTLFADGGSMVHPLTAGSSSTTVTEPGVEVQQSAYRSCGRDVALTVDAASAFSGLRGYEVLLDGKLVRSGQLDVHRDASQAEVATLTVTLTAAELSAATQSLEVRATGSDGVAGPPWTSTVSSACPDRKLAVVGDSIEWGQGLKEQDKFWKIIQRDLEQGGRRVEPTVYAHSGGVLAGKSETCAKRPGEVPYSSPEVLACQVPRVIADGADIVLLDGCINDVQVTEIIKGPLAVDARFDICERTLPAVVDALHEGLPKAKIVLTGYYPFVSSLSLASPGLAAAKIQPFVGVGVALTGVALSVGPGHFDRTFRDLAHEVLQGREDYLAFADPAFEPQHSLFVPGSSLLWEGTNDDVLVPRHQACHEYIAVLDVGLYTKCNIASMGHPNVKGALRYADAIKALPSYQRWRDTVVDYTSNPDGTPVPVSPGDTVGTGDTPGEDPGSIRALNVDITSPVAGTISIAPLPDAVPPQGYDFAGYPFRITAPQATAADPLRLVFRLDSIQVPSDGPVQVRRNGVTVPTCTSSTSTSASPDPCVLTRVRASDQDLIVTVLTSAASTWDLGGPVAAVESPSPSSSASPVSSPSPSPTATVSVSASPSPTASAPVSASPSPSPGSSVAASPPGSSPASSSPAEQASPTTSASPSASSAAPTGGPSTPSGSPSS
ncbi:MAG: hypothetical protein JWO60_3289, partial [Frankiales bacterium]|nr:hypothetical protein [Frankiales bacterium]